MPTRFLINQCQLITFLILKSDNIENSRVDLKGIILQVPSNQIKITFIIILPLTWYICDFFLFHIEIEGKCGWVIGWTKGYVGPPLKLLGGGGAGPLPTPPPPFPTPMAARYVGLIPCHAQQQQFSDALDTLYLRGVGRNTSRQVRIWHRQTEMIGRTDWY